MHYTKKIRAIHKEITLCYHSIKLQHFWGWREREKRAKGMLSQSTVLTRIIPSVLQKHFCKAVSSGQAHFKTL